MSFCPMRMAMSQVREIDFSGATVLDVRPTSSTLSFSLYEAEVAEGESRVAVDWGDGSVVMYAPDADRRVSLSHAYSRSGTYSVRIQNRLSRLVYSHCAPSYADAFSETLSSFTGARALHGVDSVGSAVQNRTLSYGMFCYTGIESAPSGYSAPLISRVNSSARMIPCGCFMGCSSLTSIAGLDLTGVVAVDTNAFYCCSSLPDLSAFSGCELLHIGPGAFFMCKSLKSVDGLSGSALADGCDDSLFVGSSYVKVNGNTLRVLGSGDAIASDLDPDGKLSGSRRYYRVQHFLMGLGEKAFNWCLSLESVAALKGFSGVLLPGTFSHCSSLATVPDELVAKQGSGYYQNTCTNGSACYAYVHTGWTSVYAHSSIVPSAPSLGWGWSSGGTFDGCPAPNVVKGTFPVVAGGQYKDCTGITDVTFSASASCNYSIGSDAFSGCTALRAVRFPTQTMEQVKTAGSPDLSGYGCLTSRRGYPFGLPSGCVIYCSDGNLTVP
jgi:hypothetical protein